MWIERTQNLYLQKLAQNRPVILLTGARQTGKSTLLKPVFKTLKIVR
jgi:predicted AAA+ superfamily ATPase